MKGEPLQKPPPLLLPGKNNPRGMQGRVTRGPARYDNYNGILKRVCDMKLGMDTDETTTESESSSVRTRSSRSSGVPYASSCEEPGSPFEDESSASSVTGSDHSPPYEEIPMAMKRLSCSSLQVSNGRSLHSFRENLPPPPTPTPVYSNESVRLSRRSSSGSSQYSTGCSQSSKTGCSQYSTGCSESRGITGGSQNNIADVTRRRSSRPTSLYSNCEQDYVNTRTPLYSNTPDPDTSTDVNDNEQTTTERLEISETERRQIEMFFRGLRTELWVSTSLANMYISLKGQEGGWTFKHTGVPLLVLESGDTKSRSKRRIQIILAERGTCFPLWKDTIDNLTSYRKAGHAFHTMYLSSDHRQMVGLSFDSSEEADRLLSTIEVLTADPENINISVPGVKNKKKKTKDKKVVLLPQKKQISNPCLFEHVTSVAAKDRPAYMSLKTLLDQGLLKKTENIA